MKVLMSNIRQKETVSELENIGARKIYKFVFYVEFFDFAEQNPGFYCRPLRSPRGFSRLFANLDSISKANKTLEQSLVSLRIYEDEYTGQITMKRLGSRLTDDQVLFETKFEISKRAQIEENLLMSGLVVVKSVNVEKTVFLYSRLVAKYSLIVENQNCQLLVEAPDQVRTIEALNLIGLSIDAGQVV